MPPTLSDLTPQERLALIGQLWDSLDDCDLAVTPAQAAELDRRLATFDEDRLHAVPWQDLRRELRPIATVKPTSSPEPENEEPEKSREMPKNL